MINRNTIAGAMYGVALGDAMGAPVEFTGIKTIHKMLGTHGELPLPASGLFTDDTQMTIAVARAMRNARSISPREMVRTLRKQFIAWQLHDSARAPGITCTIAISRLRHSPWMRWFQATNPSSKGCGANMRVVPTAFLDDTETALNLAQLQAAMTHGHPTALAATELTALAVRLAAQGMPLTDIPRWLTEYSLIRMEHGTYRTKWLGRLRKRWPLGVSTDTSMRAGWGECLDMLCRLNSLLDRSPAARPDDACAVLGGGWVAEEALVLGLYYAVTYRESAPLVVSEAARTDGDSDSIASIAGAIIGAALGENAWPEDWRRRIERRADIEAAINIITCVGRVHSSH